MAHSHVLLGAGESPVDIIIRCITLADLKDALRLGMQDFLAMPTHAVFLCLIYPLIGLLAARLAFGYSVLPLLYPLASGFALAGPLAGLALCELSRRRELGLETSAAHALDVVKSSSIGSIVALGLLLLSVVVLWVAVANALYVAEFGYAPPVSIRQFAYDVLTTTAGWRLIIIGNAIGFIFAVVAFTISAVSLPLLLDRDVGAAVALSTSIRAVVQNPLIMAVWGLIIGALLFVGSLPAFLGLTVTLPILGHTTWHLYRRLVQAGDGPQPTQHPPPKEKRYAADFPAVLFPWAR
jgi:uncharacterized membrane protein